MVSGISPNLKRSKVGKNRNTTTTGSTGKDGVVKMAVGAVMNVTPSRWEWWTRIKA